MVSGWAYVVALPPKLKKNCCGGECILVPALVRGRLYTHENGEADDESGVLGFEIVKVTSDDEEHESVEEESDQLNGLAANIFDGGLEAMRISTLRHARLSAYDRDQVTWQIARCSNDQVTDCVIVQILPCAGSGVESN